MKPQLDWSRYLSGKNHWFRFIDFQWDSNPTRRSIMGIQFKLPAFGNRHG